MVGLGRHGESVLKKTCQKLKLGVRDTQDRAVWKNGILGNRLTRVVARKNDVKR